MSKRRHAVPAFRPRMDQLEKLTGVSSLAIGAVFSLQGAGQITSPPASQGEPDAATGGISDGATPGTQPVVPIAETKLPAFQSLARNNVELISTKDKPATSAAASAPSPAAGTIRPLAMAPSPQTNAMAVQPMISLPTASGDAVGNGVTGVTPSAAQTAPVNPAGNGASAQANSAPQTAPMNPAGNGASTQANSAPQTAPMNPAGNGASAQANSAPQTAPMNPAGNGASAQANYVATGGGKSTAFAAEVAPNDSGGGSSGGGTDPQIRNSGTIAGTSTAATVYIAGKFTFTPSSPSGGGGSPIPETLNITASGGGTYVGSSASFGVTSSIGTLTNISWKVTGATPAYTGNTFSNTPGAMQWNHPAYTPPAAQAGSNANSSISFYWGEIPGADTVTVTANVVVPAGSGTIQGTPTATASVTVSSPSVFWVLDYEPSVRTTGQIFTYSYYNATSQMTTPGIKWAFSNYYAGTESVEQLMTGATLYEATDNSANPAASWSGPKNTQGQAAPFPLVDGSASATLPWYDSTPQDGQDSPSMGLDKPNATYAKMNESFTDYVMYNPGGIYVPVAKFSWQIQATATGSGLTWVPTTTAAGPLAMPTGSTAWPQAAKDSPANNYNQLL